MLLISELSTLIVIVIISFSTNDLLHFSGVSVENDPVQWLSFAHTQSSQQENWLAKSGNFYWVHFQAVKRLNSSYSIQKSYCRLLK